MPGRRGNKRTIVSSRKPGSKKTPLQMGTQGQLQEKLDLPSKFISESAAVSVKPIYNPRVSGHEPIIHAPALDKNCKLSTTSSLNTSNAPSLKAQVSISILMIILLTYTFATCVFNPQQQMEELDSISGKISPLLALKMSFAQTSRSSKLMAISLCDERHSCSTQPGHIGSETFLSASHSIGLPQSLRPLKRPALHYLQVKKKIQAVYCFQHTGSQK